MMFVLGLAACATTQKDKHIYQVKLSDESQLVNISRDGKAYQRNQNGIVSDCSTILYINGEKVGDYTLSEQSSYYLEPGNYTLQVKNCQGRCSSYDVDFVISSNSEPPAFTLSLDLSGKPFIIKR